MGNSTKILEERIKKLVDKRLFAAYWDAVAHFNSTDLVMFFEESNETNPIAAYVRDSVITSNRYDGSLRVKLAKPARESTFVKLTTSETAFWFVPIFADGEMACLAINAKQIAPGGRG
jgi:hypothetical protein